jgi:uncharacterized protein YvpB
MDKILIKNYKHKVASHCESGSLRNLLNFEGLNISEPMIFGIGTGLVFAYLKNAKGVSGFPMTAIRFPMGTIVKNVSKLLGIKTFFKMYKTTNEAIKMLDDLLAKGKPVAACVDMFYMKYLPPFMQIHVPLHFIVIFGKEGDDYIVSDPYSPQVAKLNIEYLKSAWQTNAMFSSNNLVVYIEDCPKEVNLKPAIIQGLKSACRTMVLPPIVKSMFPMFGIEGIKMFAREMTKWVKKYRGVQLREGIMFSPTILEEQGTGGGAFRMLFAAFLQESAEIFNSDPLRDIARKMVENGEKWRDASRELIKIGKPIPLENDKYPAWFEKNGKKLEESLIEASKLFIDRAIVEERIFTELKKIIPTLI